LITIVPDEADVHPDALVTVKVYVFAARPFIVMLVPVPEYSVPSGVLVSIQFPAAGKPLKTTLPVATVQVG